MLRVTPIGTELAGNMLKTTMPTPRRAFLAVALALALPGFAPAARADELVPGVIPAVADEGGVIAPPVLDRVVRDARAESPSPVRPLVVLVHGFNHTRASAGETYLQVAQQMARTPGDLTTRPIVIGLYWKSAVGSLSDFVLRGTGSRLTSLLGMRNALKNPYLVKRAEAENVGRLGLRSLLSGLRQAFPQAPLHVMTHSLGAQVLVSALATTGSAEDDAPTIDFAVLVGADLDHDIFARNVAARGFLDRVRMLWLTVPERGNADGALELRRGAGRGDAIGNRGITAPLEVLEPLIARRALVLDVGNVPPTHASEDYFNARRVRELLAAFAWFSDPKSPDGQVSLPAAIQRAADGIPFHIDDPHALDETVRAYALWRDKRYTEPVIGFNVDNRDRRQSRRASR